MAMTPSNILAVVSEYPKLRPRDLAAKIKISEAELAAAYVGENTVRVRAHPDDIIPAAERFGEAMALTRNDACVHEKVGTYGEYHPGQHAAMTLTENIDLRMFPSHWVHAYAVQTETQKGVQRSLQVFDAAGDAVHKVYLREASHTKLWDEVVAGLAAKDQSQGQSVAARVPVEMAKIRKDKLDILRAEWVKLTDTHQFLRLCAKLKMNRLGAYRIAGAPFVRPLQTRAVDLMLQQLSAAGFDVMLFVGNRGCIQIHTGPIQKLMPMGPWQNVMDPGFNLHLRLDKVAEVWAVDKPTSRGAAVSVEAFDAQGGLILQIFGVGKDSKDTRPDWERLVAGLPTLEDCSQ